MKTNAVRLLDTLGVRYELREYEVDPAALEAETVARKIGLPPEQVFKALHLPGGRARSAGQIASFCLPARSAAACDGRQRRFSHVSFSGPHSSSRYRRSHRRFRIGPGHSRPIVG